MKKRYIYALMFGVPGFFIALLVALAVFGAVAGGMWLFMFGDDPWPEAVVRLMPLFFGIVLLAVWTLVVIQGFLLGKRHEAEAEFNRKHLTIAVVLTVVPILLILLQQWSVGNLGPKSDGELCSDFCLERGYNGSGMPPRNSDDRSCYCLDDNGHEMIRIPIVDIPVDSK